MSVIRLPVMSASRNRIDRSIALQNGGGVRGPASLRLPGGQQGAPLDGDLRSDILVPATPDPNDQPAQPAPLVPSGPPDADDGDGQSPDLSALEEAARGGLDEPASPAQPQEEDKGLRAAEVRAEY